jgi:hypothetical protein
MNIVQYTEIVGRFETPTGREGMKEPGKKSQRPISREISKTISQGLDGDTVDSASF